MAQVAGSKKPNSYNRRSSVRGPKKSTKEEIAEVQAIFQDVLPGKLEEAPERLTDQLSGKLLLKFDDKLQYLCDGTNRTVSLVDKDAPEVDCTISLRSSDFMKISKGVLNPQIAMLSDKITISGKTSLAVYLFNLIAPHDLH